MIAAALLSLALVASPGASAVMSSVAGSATLHTSAAATCVSGPSHSADGVRRFWTTDTHCYSSRWFAGRHRVMIWFGCTSAPYYPKSAACHGIRGFHHGIDIDMPRGTAVRSAVNGVVVKGTLGQAYGAHAFIIRTAQYDIVLGHVGKVFVADGQQVKPGQVVAASDQLGAPDGPHLHFEVRPRGGGYQSALNPRRLLLG